MTATTRALPGASARGQLGDRAMVRLEPRTVTMYRVEWEYDGHQHDPGCEEDGWCATTQDTRRVRVKFFRNKGAAYNWMALRLIFAKRNKLATGIGSSGYPEGCRLCDAETKSLGYNRTEEGPVMCRYHDHGGEYFEQLRTRLRRWLQWRDQRTSSPQEARQ